MNVTEQPLLPQEVNKKFMELINSALSNKSVKDNLPFRFINPIPRYAKAYEEAGSGGLIGRVIGTGVEGVTDLIKSSNTDPLLKTIVTGYTEDYSRKPPVARLEAQPQTQPQTQTQPQPQQNLTVRTLPVGNITVTGANTSGRAGYSPRTYRDASGNVIASGISSATGHGGFVGSATDAEAARGLQSRAEQDEATSKMVSSFDRQIEALRDLRAEKMGISREALDASEGRGKAAQDIVERNPFAMPGDSFGDDIIRRDKLFSIINDPNARKADKAAALNTFQSFMEIPQPVKLQQPQSNPLDTNRFLLDREKFSWQQKLDKNRTALDKNRAALNEANMLNNTITSQIQQQKYADERRKDFIQSYSYPDKNAPREQLGALALSLSDSINGAIPPEIMSGYIQKAAKEAAKEANVDWEDAPPKSLIALGKRAMELAKLDMQQ